MNNLRECIGYINMRKLSNLSGVSYDVLRNYSCGRKEHLSDEEVNAVVKALREIMLIGGIK